MFVGKLTTLLQTNSLSYYASATNVISTCKKERHKKEEDYKQGELTFDSPPIRDGLHKQGEFKALDIWYYDSLQH